MQPTHEAAGATPELENFIILGRNNNSGTLSLYNMSAVPCGQPLRVGTEFTIFVSHAHFPT